MIFFFFHLAFLKIITATHLSHKSMTIRDSMDNNG